MPPAPSGDMSCATAVAVAAMVCGGGTRVRVPTNSDGVWSGAICDNLDAGN